MGAGRVTPAGPHQPQVFFPPLKHSLSVLSWILKISWHPGVPLTPFTAVCTNLSPLPCRLCVKEEVIPKLHTDTLWEVLALDLN